jgi:hypothetical protein
MSRFKRDNIAGIDYSNTNVVVMIFLIPGLIFQWFLYIFGGLTKTYTAFRVATRISRSPLFTYFFAFVFWVGFFTWLYPEQMIVVLGNVLVIINNLISAFNSPAPITP